MHTGEDGDSNELYAGNRALNRDESQALGIRSRLQYSRRAQPAQAEVMRRAKMTKRGKGHGKRNDTEAGAVRFGVV